MKLEIRYGEHMYFYVDYLSEISLLDDCETRNEYPHEQAERQWRRGWQCRWRN